MIDYQPRRFAEKLSFNAYPAWAVAAWWRATDYTAVANNPYLLSSLSDKTGNGRALTATTSENAPTMLRDAGAGYAGASFNGRNSGGRAITTWQPLGGTNPRTIIAVLGQVRTTATVGILFSANLYGVSLSQTAGYQLLNGLGQTYNSNIPPSAGLPDVVIAAYTGTQHLLYVNGAQVIAVASGAAAAGPLWVGNNFAGAGSPGLAPGYFVLHELAVCEAWLGLADVLRINSLLQLQYRTGR